MEHTMAEAARRAGVSKSTLLRRVKAGKISARLDDEGVYRIDAAELARVYPGTVKRSDAVRDAPHDAPRSAPDETPDAARASDAMLASALKEVQMLREMQAQEREAWERERAALMAANQDLRRLLPRPDAPQKGWLTRLFRTSSD